MSGVRKEPGEGKAISRTGNRAGRATVVTGTGQLGPTVFCAADSPSGGEGGTGKWGWLMSFQG